MHTPIQTIITMIIGVVLMMFGLTFGLSLYNTNNSQMASNSAVQAALMDSQDGDARVVRGVFAINRDKFTDDINSNQNAILNSYKKNYTDLEAKPFFLQDQSEKAQDYMKLNKTGSCIPVDGVKVMILGRKKNSDDKKHVIDVSTYVITKQVKMAPHNNDMTGDDVSNNQLPQKVIQ